jgi:hypothetical protein
MTIRVSLPREYAKGLHIGQRLRVEEVGETVVLATAEDGSRIVEPEIFVGSNWDGLSFERPPNRVPEFVDLLAQRLQPARTVLYYSEAGEDRAVEAPPAQLPRALAQIGDRVLDHTFSVEFDAHTLFSGGDGCFSLQADLPEMELREIAQNVLNLLGVSHQLDRDDFQVAVVDGATVVYR